MSPANDLSMLSPLILLHDISTPAHARTHAPTLTSNRGRAAIPPEIPGMSLSSFPNFQLPAAGRFVSSSPDEAPMVRGSRPDHMVSPGIIS